MVLILIDQRGLYLEYNRQGRARRVAVTVMRDEDGRAVLQTSNSVIRNHKFAIESLSEIRFFHLLVFKQVGGLVG